MMRYKRLLLAGLVGFVAWLIWRNVTYWYPLQREAIKYARAQVTSVPESLAITGTVSDTQVTYTRSDMVGQEMAYVLELKLTCANGLFDAGVDVFLHNGRWQVLNLTLANEKGNRFRVIEDGKVVRSKASTTSRK